MLCNRQVVVLNSSLSLPPFEAGFRGGMCGASLPRALPPQHKSVFPSPVRQISGVLAPEQ